MNVRKQSIKLYLNSSNEILSKIPTREIQHIAPNNPMNIQPNALTTLIMLISILLNISNEGTEFGSVNSLCEDHIGFA